MKTAIDNFSIEPRKLSFWERVYLHALSRLVRAILNGWPLRAAFWRGFLSGLGGLRSN